MLLLFLFEVEVRKQRYRYFKISCTFLYFHLIEFETRVTFTDHDELNEPKKK